LFILNSAEGLGHWLGNCISGRFKSITHDPWLKYQTEMLCDLEIWIYSYIYLYVCKKFV